MPETLNLSASPSIPQKAQSEPNDNVETKASTEGPDIPPSPRSVHGIKVRQYQYHFEEFLISLLSLIFECLQWFLVVVGILSSILLYALDTTITADVIPVRNTNAPSPKLLTDTLNYRA